MSIELSRKVLQSFKLIHKTRKSVFKGDPVALNEARIKINEEFKKNKHITDPASIEEKIKYANEVECEIRTCVIQAKEVEPGVYQAEIRNDTVKLENIPFKECDNVTLSKGKSGKSKCQQS